MESIMQSEKKCYLCGRNGSMDPLEQHHIFGGANRKLSEKYGLKVWLCGDRCHRNGPEAVHKNKQVAVVLKAKGQIAFENYYDGNFLQIFGRNYK